MTPGFSLKRMAPIVGWALLLFVVLFWRLGEPTFWDPDEAHYAETTRELLATGDWLAPYYNEQPFFDKPILFHLLQAGAMAVVGPTELGARLVPASAALALIGITFWLGVALASRSVGTVGALLLATSPGVFALARYAILDTLFTAFVFGGASLVTVAALKERPRLQYPGYVLIALAVLTKGPLAIALCGLTFLLAIAVSSDVRRRLLGLRWVLGLLLVVAIAAPWFLYMWWRFGQAFVEGYVLNENIRLFSTPMYARQPAWWFYLRILATGLLPWTWVLVGRLYDDARAAWNRTPADPFEVLLWCWAAAVVGFFSVSAFKLDHYVFPVAPALCLLFARAWDDLRADPTGPAHRGVRIGLHLVGPTLVAAGLGAGFFLVARLALPPPAFIVPISIAAAGAWMIARVVARGGRPPRVPVMVISSLTITYAALVLFMMPVLEQRKVVPDLARWVTARAAVEDRVASYQLNRWSTAWRFYVGRHTTLLETPDQIREFLDRPGPVYCAMRGSAYEELVALGIPLRVAYEREGLWATSGRALWRNQPESTRFVVATRAPASVEPARSP